VLSEKEIDSRYEIFIEGYVKTITIEGQMTALIGKTQILPAALRYQTEVANSISALKAAGVASSDQDALLKEISTLAGDLKKKLDALTHVLDHHAAGDSLSHATYARDKVLVAMADVRKDADKLEAIVADDLWPLPTYREMLFIK